MVHYVYFVTPCCIIDDAAEFKPKKPKLYFDLYKFKCYLKRRKREIKTEEMLHIMKQTIRPPPSETRAFSWFISPFRSFWRRRLDSGDFHPGSWF